ncbi:PREDICTED: protein FREE1 [Tarenaya hassleriana]|uniref:protein FREE1 n=1 Tax=Tarenaya hassleriana TaxID=28532 RepID=UPI00053C9271|nr:PREDICTED: protein FREE1 [Tarenaya hassleriana]
MQQGDHSSYYHQYAQFQNPNPNPNPNLNPNPNPTPATVDPSRSSYASAPPFTGGYGGEYSPFTQNYQSYTQNSDHVLPSAPSFTPAAQPPPPPPPPSTSVNPNSYTSSFNQSPPAPAPVSLYGSFESSPPYQQSTGHSPYFPAYDQHQNISGYVPPPSPPSAVAPNSNPISGPPYASSLYSAPPYSAAGASVSPSYESPYDNPVKFDQPAYGGFGRSRSDLSSDLYGKRSDSGGYAGYEDSYGDGVYAYEGGKVEPYGARGTAPKSSNSTLFDDYGRSISFSSSRNSSANSGLGKIVRAVPKADTQEDVKSGVQKFRVKLLAETYGQTTMDVLCQVGLDGIRMLDPSTSRTLRIYPLENVTRCEKLDSSILAFWSKSPVDIEPRRIRLQSNSYTTNTLLDTVTAAMFQAKEIGGSSSRPPASVKPTEQAAEKKKGFADWMNIIKPVNEEKEHWVPDEAVSKCTSCGTDFGAFVRRHHCRNCGDIFCDKCTQGRIALTAEENAPQVRVCDRCMAEVSERLSNTKEAANRYVGPQSHEDLARKLQGEMEKNRKSSSGSRDDGGSGRRMKEVACPTCTVHLQVQVPISGSETIECGVCQNPFLVSAH